MHRCLSEYRICGYFIVHQNHRSPPVQLFLRAYDCAPWQFALRFPMTSKRTLRRLWHEAPISAEPSSGITGLPSDIWRNLRVSMQPGVQESFTRMVYCPAIQTGLYSSNFFWIRFTLSEGPRMHTFRPFLMQSSDDNVALVSAGRYQFQFVRILSLTQ